MGILISVRRDDKNTPNFPLCRPRVSTLKGVEGVRKFIACRNRAGPALFFTVQLRSYQQPHAQKLLEVLARNPMAQDGSDMGTGKTYAGAWIAAALKKTPLVICPLSVIPTWEGILREFHVDQFSVWSYQKAWRHLCRVVPWGKGSFLEWKEHHPFFIFDEDHRCQSRTTMQGKMMIAARRQADRTCGRILGLSATAADSPLKMGPLGFALGLHRLDDFYSWLDRHGCPELTLGPKDKPEKQWKERIFLKSKQDEVMASLNHEIYDLRGARLKIADIPDFPQTQIDVRLLDGQDKQVQRLSKELKEFYENRKLRSELTEDELARTVFLRQSMEISKVPVLMDLAEDALETSKVVIFANYSATLDALAEACTKAKLKFGFIRGDQTGEDRARAISDFQADRLDVMLANVQAGGVGVSLHSLARVPRTALICPTFSAVDLRQCLGRVRRDGGGPSVQHVVYFHGTIEERVAKSVQAKLDRLDLLNDGELETGQAELALEEKA